MSSCKDLIKELGIDLSDGENIEFSPLLVDLYLNMLNQMQNYARRLVIR